MTKKVIYWIAGTQPTANEQKGIDYLNARRTGQYQVAVRSAAGPVSDQGYDAGADLESADYCACVSGGAIPTAYSGKSVLTVPQNGSTKQLVIGPAGLSFAHTTVSQMTALEIDADGTVTDVTDTVAWSSGTGATATIGASTGKLTGVAAGTTLITATLTDGSNSVTATETVTCS